MSHDSFRQRWNKFFFSPTDPTPIGIFRILFGIIIIINGLMLWPDLLVWYGEKGVLPLGTSIQMLGPNRINLLALLPTGDSWIIGFYIFHLLAALFFTLGLFTRASSIALFVSLVSLHHRNTLILNSGDTLIRIISFLLIFSHAGTTLSLDWVRKKLKDGDQWGKSSLIAPWAQRMIQIQVCLVYVYTCLWKLQGFTWRDGTAVYYTSRLEEFERFPVPWIFENLMLMKLLTWSTLIIELSMGTLVWIPSLRPYILLIALSLHLGLEYSMNIPLFQFIILSTYILFIDPAQLYRMTENLKQFTARVFKKPIPSQLAFVPFVWISYTFFSTC